MSPTRSCRPSPAESRPARRHQPAEEAAGVPGGSRIILGLDPGTAATGYGVVEQRGARLAAVAYGVIETPADMQLHHRLDIIFRQVAAVLDRYRTGGGCRGVVVLQRERRARPSLWDRREESRCWHARDPGAISSNTRRSR